MSRPGIGSLDHVQAAAPVIATITAAPQASWSEARAAFVVDGLSFSPRHGLAAHRPLD